MMEIINLYTQEVGHAPNVVHEGGWMVTILGLVAAHLGVSILPSNVKNLKREGLIYKDILDSQYQQPIKLKNSLALIYRKDNTSKLMQNFQQAIQEACETRSSAHPFPLSILSISWPIGIRLLPFPSFVSQPGDRRGAIPGAGKLPPLVLVAKRNRVAWKWRWDDDVGLNVEILRKIAEGSIRNSPEA